MNYDVKIGGRKFATAALGTGVVSTVALFIAAQMRAAQIDIDDATMIVLVAAVGNGAIRFLANFVKTVGLVS